MKNKLLKIIEETNPKLIYHAIKHETELFNTLQNYNGSTIAEKARIISYNYR